LNLQVLLENFSFFVRQFDLCFVIRPIARSAVSFTTFKLETRSIISMYSTFDCQVDGFVFDNIQLKLLQHMLQLCSYFTTSLRKMIIGQLLQQKKTNSARHPRSTAEFFYTCAALTGQSAKIGKPLSLE
jgi:hypothetical protein